MNDKQQEIIERIRAVATRLFEQSGGDIKACGLNAVHREVGGSKSTTQRYLPAIHDELLGSPKLRDAVPAALRTKTDDLLLAVFKDAQVEAERAYLDRSQALADLLNTSRNDLELAAGEIDRLESEGANLRQKLDAALLANEDLTQRLVHSEDKLVAEKVEHAQTGSLLDHARAQSATLSAEVARLKADTDKMSRIETMIAALKSPPARKPGRPRKSSAQI